MMQADRYLTDKEKSAIELYFGLNADSAAEYNALKEQYPDALVGFEQNGQFEFYGEDARKICELTGGKLLERETALGTVLVTGFPREQWVYRAKQLWECGENIYLAGLNEDGTHHQTKYLRREDYLPVGSIVHMEGREFRVDKVDLLGAIRLPNNAFRANAGTDVVSDIIFLQKRDRPIDHEPAWVQLGKTEDGISINSYFADHPEMILGELTTESTQYGKEEATVVPIEGANLADQLREAVQQLEGRYLEAAAEVPDIAETEAERRTLPADPDVKNFSYTVVEGEVYYRENSVMTQVELSGNAKDRVVGMPST